MLSDSYSRFILQVCGAPQVRVGQTPTLRLGLFVDY